MNIKPVTTEKAVRLIDVENTLLFEIPRVSNKEEIKKEIESTLNVKVENIRTYIQLNKKFAYVRLKKNYLAADVATKLGMI